MRELSRCVGAGGIAAAACALALAACGSSPRRDGTRTTASASHSQGIRFANCMRSHGVTGFPDPSAGGGGIKLDGTGINPQSPTFQSARQACAHLSPHASPRGVTATESQFRKAVKFAECMRAHGYKSFPDPTRTDSPPGPIFIAGSGLFFRVSTTFDPTAPAVRHTLAECARQ